MSRENPKRVVIKTFGCQMNVYDSERMAELVGTAGYAASDDPAAADLVILNTCHIREKAAEKVYSELGRLRRLKEQKAASGEEMIVAVAGCVAQAEGGELVRRAPVVDLVVGPQAYHRLPDLLARARSTGRSVVETEFPAGEKFASLDGLRHRALPRGVAAFVTVQEGCDKFCTFCVVPYTRGAEYSRSAAEIEAEVRALVRAGVREVTLLGQNVNAYHGSESSGATGSLARLIDRLSRIEALDRIRYTTSHPQDMDDDLIAAHATNPKVMPYLHLPVQSGSDAVLKRMNRQHTAQFYLDLVARVRRARPDIALSSDFIVGFPGETEADFRSTLALLREVRFAQAFSFKYSPRPGTPSADWEDQVEPAVKAERLTRLQALIDAHKDEFNASCLGRELDILLERPGRHPGQLVGRSPYLQAVHVEDCRASVGETVRARIVALSSNSLSARIVE
jgi:tRNA-2-methylthio-N6-dimethylallyladenosine synthase